MKASSSQYKLVNKLIEKGRIERKLRREVSNICDEGKRSEKKQRTQ